MKLKKLGAAVLAASLVLGGVVVATPIQKTYAASDFSYSQEAKDALEYINNIRAEAGLGQVTLNPFLTKAAENHAKYLSSNKTTGHEELGGKAGFTGEDAEVRVLAISGDLKQSQGTSEVITYNMNSVITAVDDLLNSAYHRDPFLNTGTSEVGVSLYAGYFVLTYHLDASSNATSLYPYNSQTGVPTSFIGATENPNPLSKFGIQKSGYVISFYPPHFLDTKKIDATIKDSSGNNVPFFSEWYNGFWFFYTKEPMKNSETYTVSVNYKPLYEPEFEGQTLNKTWSFTTVAGSNNSGGSQGSTPDPNEPNIPPSDITNAIGVGEKYSKTNVGVKINGKSVELSPKAKIVNGSTFIPLRGVFEQLNSTVAWNQKAQQITITRGSTVVKLTVNSKTAYINGQKKTLLVAPFVDKTTNSTYVPLRFASEAIGAKVSWDQVEYLAEINAQ
ncbi:hypothetical protein J41TS12_36880 [Paenibacillus antibioticophila]|uniref:Uncharacterized protein n=1 Tax=Paenibacillus antibioticophila TaxID=1274374 RepID=A0A919XYA5_9BACL|nr:stalk domain-containing protein [Paenibacillus antibioticophila]GIO38827.1 hypothetical protein J41TS12_36880 [Paenibacillus antibioticophila]